MVDSEYVDFADIGLDALTASEDRTGEDLPPWMIESKEPTRADARDIFLGLAANAMMFGLGLMTLTQERRAGALLVRAGAVLAVPALALIVLAEETEAPKPKPKPPLPVAKP